MILPTGLVHHVKPQVVILQLAVQVIQLSLRHVVAVVLQVYIITHMQMRDVINNNII